MIFDVTGTCCPRNTHLRVKTQLLCMRHRGCAQVRHGEATHIPSQLPKTQTLLECSFCLLGSPVLWFFCAVPAWRGRRDARTASQGWGTASPNACLCWATGAESHEDPLLPKPAFTIHLFLSCWFPKPPLNTRNWEMMDNPAGCCAAPGQAAPRKQNSASPVAVVGGRRQHAASHCLRMPVLLRREPNAPYAGPRHG